MASKAAQARAHERREFAYQSLRSDMESASVQALLISRGASKSQANDAVRSARKRLRKEK